MSSPSELNAAQLRAVLAGDGPVAIVAGPGTGKTKTLVAQIERLISSGRARPEAVLALAFTNKAAREIAERVAGALPSVAEPPRITTFHGLCYELLQAHHTAELRIISESDRLELIRSLKKRANVKALSLRELSAKLSGAKGSLGSPPEPVIADLLNQYNEQLRTQSTYDFDDLLRQTYDLLQSQAAFREQVQKRFSHILVDEFQDTSELQYELLRLINRADNLFVIGDPAQAIYGFRGGDAAVFDRFAADFPNARQIVLETNYRSAPEIVRLANAIFPDSPALTAHRTSAGSVRVVEALNEYSEAACIINGIEQSFGGTDFLRSHQADSASERSGNFRDYAVLYRTHHVAAALKSHFRECGIPYQIVGAGSPYEDPMIQAIVHVMRYLAEPSSEARQSALRNAKLRKFSENQFAAASNQLSHNQRPSELAGKIADALGLVGSDAAKRSALHQFTNSLVRLDDRGLADCLRRLDELAEQNFYDDQADAVTLLSIHASKGLEFDHVFLIAAEDGILPHAPKAAEPAPEHLAEERRLFYVAASRAKSRLDILHTRSRGGSPASLSPFVQSLSATLLPRTIDPNLAAQQISARKRQLKRSQTRLF